MLAVEADRHPEMSNSPSRSPRALEARASETRRPSPKTASVLRASKVWSATRKSRALTRLRRPKTRSGVVRRGSYAEDLRNRRSLELNLSSDESEDFKSDVRLHFRHRDFDPLRQFEGRSSLQTYLTVVISRLLLDHRNGLSGRWRTSTDAKRLGPSAIPIERLVAHDVFWGLPDGGHARPAQKVTPLAGVEAYESADLRQAARSPRAPREAAHDHNGSPTTKRI